MTAIQYPQWKSIHFDENLNLIKENRTFLYLVIGPRLILLNLDENEFGLSQTSMLKAISYACIENLAKFEDQDYDKIEQERTRKNKSNNLLNNSNVQQITFVQVYQIFARRICSLNLKKWKKWKKLLEFLKQCKANDFSYLEEF